MFNSAMPSQQGHIQVCTSWFAVDDALECVTIGHGSAIVELHFLRMQVAPIGLVFCSIYLNVHVNKTCRTIGPCKTA
jgi:hypothetical protein